MQRLSDFTPSLSDLAPKCMGVRPDKGEVGGSSPPRPTISQREVLSKKAHTKDLRGLMLA